MKFNRLSIQGLRNLAPTSLELSPTLNLVIGANGSGKSSLLEAFHLLSTAKSFRAKSLQTVLQDNAEELLLVADVGVREHLGFSFKAEGERRIRYQGQNLSSSAELARMLPVQLLDHQMFQVLDKGPKVRRQALDWGVFHVEQAFIEEWRQYQRALVQRNALLKQRVSGDSVEWDLWEAPLLKFSEAITRKRKLYLERLQPHLKQTLESFIPELAEGIAFRLYQGWKADADFKEVIQRSRESDARLGYTSSGPHRADLRITTDGIPADRRLSRGQQKMLVAAFKIAQSALYLELNQRPTIFLVDDLAAELDMAHRTALCRWLERLECQTFITCIDASAVTHLWGADTQVAMFHVEHGHITQGESSP